MNSAALRLTAFAIAAMPSAGFPTPQYSLAPQDAISFASISYMQSYMQHAVSHG